MPPPALELAAIFRLHGPVSRQAHDLRWQQRGLMQAIENCRPPALGSVVECCSQCQYPHIQYRSCRNRHCPKCQGLARARWLQQRQAELLPVEYFHVVFTVPELMAQIAFYNKAVVYEILFRPTAQTLLTIARYPKRLGVEMETGQVSFKWKDSRARQQPNKVMTVAVEDFIRRFLQHALPAGFQRIRYYGFLANCHRQTKLDLCRQLLAPCCQLLPSLADCRDYYAALTGRDLRRCPLCGLASLLRFLLPPLWQRPAAFLLDSS